MPQLSVHDRVDEILKLDLAAHMKKLGFRKRTRGFARDAQAKGGGAFKAVQVVEIIVGGSESSHEGVVSATFAVYYPDFVPTLTPWQTKPPAQVKAVDGQARATLGQLGPWNNPEHSWRIDAATEDATISRELSEAIEKYGLPFLDDMLDLAKVATSPIDSVKPELKALAFMKLGKKDQARSVVDAILASRPKSYMEVASFAGRLKLPVPPRPAK